VWGDVGCTRVTRPALWPRGVKIEGVKQMDSADVVKRRSKNGFYASSDSSYDMPYKSRVYGQPYLKRVPSVGQSRPEQPERGTKQHKGWPTFWRTQGPIEGTRRPQASYLSLDRKVSFMPLCGLAASRSGFLRGLPGKEV
jgi:hypothetical protein